MSSKLIPSSPLDNYARIAWKRILRELSSLPRAITLMALIVALSAIGTFIPQNKVCTSPQHSRDLSTGAHWMQCTDNSAQTALQMEHQSCAVCGSACALPACGMLPAHRVMHILF